jgi:hypothetical protein
LKIWSVISLRVVVLQVTDIRPPDLVRVLVEVIVAGGSQTRQALVDLHLEADERGEGVVFLVRFAVALRGHRRVSVGVFPCPYTRSIWNAYQLSFRYFLIC